MRPLRFGVVALGLVFVYCAAVALRAFYRVPPGPKIESVAVTDLDVALAKSALCRLARSEHAFYASVGRYASDAELRTDGNLNLPVGELRPYLYSIHVPVPDRFVIVATTYGALQQQPPALVVDDRLELCIVRSDLPNQAWQLDNPPQRWGHIGYDCTPCDGYPDGRVLR